MSRKVLIGKIVSDKMQKTVVVEVERKVAHPVYKKLIKKTKRFKADVNNMEVKVGDLVKMEETPPISRSKHFKVIGKVKLFLQHTKLYLLYIQIFVCSRCIHE